jgi:hypothetical protein
MGERIRKVFTLEQFKKWGSKGGKTTGKSKVRGDSEYYRQLAKKRKNIKIKNTKEGGEE